MRTKVRRKSARRERLPVPRATRPNHYWAMDFVGDKLADGTSFRVLTVVDQYSRECITLLGAPVASLRSRILRLGESSVSAPAWTHSAGTMGASSSGGRSRRRP